MTDISITVIIVIFFLILLIFILTGLLYMKLQTDKKNYIDNTNNTNDTIITYQPYTNDFIYYNKPFWRRSHQWRRPHRFLRY